MKTLNYEERLDVPDALECSLVGNFLTVKGPKATLKKNFVHPKVGVTIDGKSIVFRIPRMTKREKTMLGTFRSHIKNMFAGVQQPYVYKLKICSGHFPMAVTVTKNELQIKNFVGEKIARKMPLYEGVSVKVEGEVITVESADKDLAGQTAASIEQLTRRPGFDPRIFQHGCHIFQKANKELK